MSPIFATGATCSRSQGSSASIGDRSTWGGSYPGGLIDDAEDRVVATVGVGALLLGFTVQAAAYIIELGVGPSSGASASRAAIGAAAAIVPIVAFIAVERVTHRHRVDTLLVRVSRHKTDDDGKVRSDEPNIEELVRIADWRGDSRHNDESDLAYVRRVFRVRRSALPPAR